MKAKGFFLLFYFTTKYNAWTHMKIKKETKETIKIGKYWKLNVSFIILLQSTMPWTHMYALILSNPNMIDFLAVDFDLLFPYSISFFFPLLSHFGYFISTFNSIYMLLIAFYYVVITNFIYLFIFEDFAGDKKKSKKNC